VSDRLITARAKAAALRVYFRSVTNGTAPAPAPAKVAKTADEIVQLLTEEIKFGEGAE
jgi:hypothetical protein